jgi:cobaltochelatase CobN
VYLPNSKIIEGTTNFKESISKIAYISQIRDSAEYKITDLDHYYEFAGGLSKTYEYVTKKKISVYIADSTKKEVRISSLDDEVATSMITTVLNKQWIEGLLSHEKHGGQKISDRLEYMIGFSALTDSINEKYWDLCYERYIENKDIRDRLIQNNQFAMLESIKTFLEAVKRKFWNASEDKIKFLKELYMNIENMIESDL